MAPPPIWVERLETRVFIVLGKWDVAPVHQGVGAPGAGHWRTSIEVPGMDM